MQQNRMKECERKAAIKCFHDDNLRSNRNMLLLNGKLTSISIRIENCFNLIVSTLGSLFT